MIWISVISSNTSKPAVCGSTNSNICVQLKSGTRTLEIPKSDRPRRIASNPTWQSHSLIIPSLASGLMSCNLTRRTKSERRSPRSPRTLTNPKCAHLPLRTDHVLAACKVNLDQLQIRTSGMQPLWMLPFTVPFSRVQLDFLELRKVPLNLKMILHQNRLVVCCFHPLERMAKPNHLTTLASLGPQASSLAARLPHP